MGRSMMGGMDATSGTASGASSSPSSDARLVVSWFDGGDWEYAAGLKLECLLCPSAEHFYVEFEQQMQPYARRQEVLRERQRGFEGRRMEIKKRLKSKDREQAYADWKALQLESGSALAEADVYGKFYLGGVWWEYREFYHRREMGEYAISMPEVQTLDEFFDSRRNAGADL